MNAIGFFKTHHPDIACSKDVEDLFSYGKMSEDELSMMVIYLEKGMPVISFISDLYENGERIGHNIIYTDGFGYGPLITAFI